MDRNLLEIREYCDPGYQPVIDFETWRVAILNFLEEIHPDRIDFMERHNQTDEVFVLSFGQAVLFLGEGDGSVEKIHSQVLETGKIYNVKKGVWHSIVLSRSGSVLIVENKDTNEENSNYFSLDEKQRRFIAETAKNEILDWS